MNNVAIELDQKASNLAHDYLQTEGELLSTLIEMRREGVFAELNYTGIFHYCESRLKFSRAQAFYFKSVAEASERVPELKVAVVQGELTLSQARRIAPVVTPENHKQWIAQAKTLPQVELEKRVASVNPKAHVKEKIRPVAKALSELRVLIADETEKGLETLKDILSQKLGRAATLSDVVAWATKVTQEKFDPEKKAARSKKRVVSAGNAAKPGRRRIPQRVKHAVVQRDGYRCTHVGADGRRCGQKRWVHYHHIQSVKDGGLNTVENLELRCSMHHALAHRTQRHGSHVRLERARND